MAAKQSPNPPQSQPGHEHAMSPAPDYAPRYAGSGRLAGRRAFVTGGDSGIGRATAALFAREGADVAIVYLEEDRDAQETLALVDAEGARGLAIRGDVGDKAFCEEAVARTVEAFGGLDVLVNGAAEQHVEPDPLAVDEASVVSTFRTNAFGTIFMTQAALPHLGEGDAIVNIASITAYQGMPVLLDYSATKGAIVAFTRSLSKNLAGRGIRVNAVAPGPIWTPLIPSTFPADRLDEFGTSTPLGRRGQPNEVAPSVLFLACEDASYMTGQVLHPNGGTVVAG